MSLRHRSIIILASLAALGAILQLAFAGTAAALTMSPIRFELAADPGGEVHGTIKLHNDDHTAHTYFITKSKFESSGESGDPVLIPGASDGLPSWITIADRVDVGPLAYQELPFTIKVPAGAEPGGYFAALLASTVPPQAGQQPTVVLKSDVGTLLLLTVNGQFPQKESILEFNTKGKLHVYNHLPVEFYFRFQNSGADRAKPLGDITVRNIFGLVSKVITANRGAGNVLPGTIRRFDSAWVTSGGGQVESFDGTVEQPKLNGFWQAVRYQWTHFALGRYSANLKLTVNNDSSRSYSASTSFWVLPWQLILVIMGVVTAFILLAALIAGIAVLIILRGRRRK